MYNCIVVGAGSIGALKPDNIDYPGGINILTHAHAITNNKDLALITIIDPDIEKQSKIYEKWNIPIALSLDALLAINPIHFTNITGIDIVTIASPTETHERVAEEVIYKIKPKIIICEKPFCNSLEEAEHINELCKQEGIKLIINYNRRYCHLHKLGRMIHNEDFGKILSCVCTYTRGLKRDGCHAIDLFNLMFGECLFSEIVHSMNMSVINDYSPNDLTYPVYMQYEKCPNLFMVPHDGRDFSVFDFRILTSECEIFITNHGEKVVINYAEEEKIYGNYKSLDYDNHVAEYTMYMKNSLVNIYIECVNYLNSGCNSSFVFSSEPESAIEIHKIYKALGV